MQNGQRRSGRTYWLTTKGTCSSFLSIVDVDVEREVEGLPKGNNLAESRRGGD
jgi:hypothetical protein